MTLSSLAVPAMAADAASGAPAATDLDRIEVRPQIEAQARAVELKRDAQAILDAVSSDAMGDYPDKNVAESLQRLPGVSVTRDQGEGRYVVIRGLDANLNSVTVDGIAMGTPEDSSRSAPLDVIPSDSTERLKVIKSPTPDMPGDSIGGAIEVESVSAFDRDGRSVRGSVEASHQQLSGKTSPKAAFNYSDIFNDTFGVAVGVNYQDREFESDNTEVEYDEYDEDRPDDLFATEVQRRKYTIERKRTGANLNLDWRPDADNRYYFRSLYSKFEDAETRQNTVFGLGDGDVSGNGDGTYTVSDLPADAITKRVRYRTKSEDTLAASFGGEHRLTAATLDYKVGYTKTRERVNDEKEARFEYAGDDIDTVTVDQNHRIPTLDFSDNGWESNDEFEFNRFVISPKQVDDKEHSAQVNVRFDGDASSYKFGVLGRWRDRSVNSDEEELRNGPDIDLGPWTTNAPEHRGGTLGESLSSSEMRRYWTANGSLYRARPQDAGANAVTRLSEDYTASEDVLAAYAMGTWDIDALRVIAGVRVENTQFDAQGNQVDVADGGRAYTVTPTRASSSYTSVLPGLHLRYDAGNDWVLRLAATKTISRPSFGDIAPRLTVNRDDEEVDVGNPELDPYKSTNLDLSAEKYLGDSGIVSLGLFHKSIDDYIVQTFSNDDPQYPDFDVTRVINGDKAEVYGAEFNWQQQLSFLPEGWDGLLVGVSATYLDTDFDPGLADRDGDDFTLPRASKNLYSAHIGYEKYGFSARVATVYRSAYLDTIGDSKAYDIYVAPNTQLDFSMSYQFTDAVSVYFEAQNLLDEPLELYQGVCSRTLQNEEYGRTYALGLKVAL
ncbi:TonB-dependent receptor [Stenotrophomonas sp. HITSZ_GD]|uniref:TonB-dependent receptor n=1 Tax=Stenotrophomonas sp. HITSZ_GD TaxID=3037248 RepID=UPI00240E0F0B|nr:TonB-dependent receptor [Stenotrophomonas sp. HITSZ_GD]MDG2524718.1 TonB-dependent receptor [Stenotrophomonas sp. HITSZ_GD]